MLSPNQPPKGWNSYDCFGGSVTEAEVLENADFVVKNLKHLGWEYIVVDYCWFHPEPGICANPDQKSNFSPYLSMDYDFFLTPSVERFPSSKGGLGFKPLADEIHRRGLKFGIHMMRGFPRQATYPGYPSKNWGYRAKEFVDNEDTCGWLNHMYGIIPNEVGQCYYDKLFKLYAAWEIDFIKIDDIASPYRKQELEAISRAIQNCGREIVVSLSPGPCPIEEADHVKEHANMWRICADFWDDWDRVFDAFGLCEKWAPHRVLGHWPDADMLPLGRLSKRGPVGPEHDSFLSIDEQMTLLTLWTIFQSPLFIGGHLPESSPETISLLTNREILEAYEEIKGGFALRSDENESIWHSKGSENGDEFLALFNLSNQPRNIRVKWNEFSELVAPQTTRELWTGVNQPASEDISIELPPHATAFYRLKNN